VLGIQAPIATDAGIFQLPSKRPRFPDAIRGTAVLNLAPMVPGTFGRGKASPMSDGDFATLRTNMVQEILAHARLAREQIGKDSLAPSVLDALGRVPRHDFVPVELRQYAYVDSPLPIGYGKTISQPFIVALMTDILEIGGDDKVLEIGSGLGYQAAVLA